MSQKMAVVWPLAKSNQPPQRLAPRLDTLEGKTICGLFNGRYHFEDTWPLTKELLAKRYPGIKFVGWEEFGIFNNEAEPDRLKGLPEKLKQHGCDAVITGRGC